MLLDLVDKSYGEVDTLNGMLSIKQHLAVQPKSAFTEMCLKILVWKGSECQPGRAICGLWNFPEYRVVMYRTLSMVHVWSMNISKQ